MSLHLYNSLSRQKELFKPVHEGRVGVYVCGPTVYGHAHLGHAKSYVSFDILVRYLRYLNYDVTYVQNITDVGHLLGETNEGEDRMLVASRTEHKHPMAIAEYYTHSYFDDMDKLNCLRPDICPRATGHITEQIEMIQSLMDKGFAYEVNGSVYFDVSKCKDYGKLSGRNTEDMISGARVEVSPDKRNPVDFALWKKAEPNHIMQWPSPWGRGYPGWHLECSAMSMKYLGNTIDIHGGGLENKFPHHECEIAQSESASGAPFVKYWLHNNMVTVDGTKMGKSLNNFITLKEVFSGDHERLSRGYDPLAVRQLILNSHYRSTLDFSDASLYSASSGYDKITATVIALRRRENTAPDGLLDEQIASELNELKQKFEDAMNDDLNTAVALSVIFDLVRLGNRLLEKGQTSKASLDAVDKLFRVLGGEVLGIVKDKYDSQTTTAAEQERLAKLVENLLAERNKARQERNFAVADKIRDALTQSDINITDAADGTSSWSPK